VITWFTGLPGSGKTTAAIKNGGILVDAEIMRSVRPEGFDEAGRRRNVERVQDIAAYLHAAGHNVSVACIAPYKEQRDVFRGECDVQEVYLPGGEWDESYGPNIYEAP